jgi:hypothetical protein
VNCKVWDRGTILKGRVGGADLPSDQGTAVPFTPNGSKEKTAIAIGEEGTTGEANAPWPRIGPKTPRGAVKVGGRKPWTPVHLSPLECNPVLSPS